MLIFLLVFLLGCIILVRMVPPDKIVLGFLGALVVMGLVLFLMSFKIAIIPR